MGIKKNTKKSTIILRMPSHSLPVHRFMHLHVTLSPVSALHSPADIHKYPNACTLLHVCAHAQHRLSALGCQGVCASCCDDVIKSEQWGRPAYKHRKWCPDRRPADTHTHTIAHFSSHSTGYTVYVNDDVCISSLWSKVNLGSKAASDGFISSQANFSIFNAN